MVIKFPINMSSVSGTNSCLEEEAINTIENVGTLINQEEESEGLQKELKTTVAMNGLVKNLNGNLLLTLQKLKLMHAILDEAEDNLNTWLTVVDKSNIYQGVQKTPLIQSMRSGPVIDQPIVPPSVVIPHETDGYTGLITSMPPPPPKNTGRTGPRDPTTVSSRIGNRGRGQ